MPTGASKLLWAAEKSPGWEESKGWRLRLRCGQLWEHRSGEIPGGWNGLGRPPKGGTPL